MPAEADHVRRSAARRQWARMKTLVAKKRVHEKPAGDQILLL